VVAVVVEAVAVAAAVVVEAVAAAVAPVVAAAVPAMGQAAAAEVVVPPTVLAGAVAKVGAVAVVDGATTTVVDMVGAAAIVAAGATMPGAAGGTSATRLILIDRLPRRVRSAGFCLPALIRNLGRRTMNVRPQRFLCAASYQKAQRTCRDNPYSSGMGATGDTIEQIDQDIAEPERLMHEKVQSIIAALR
jgi:hypothetical protein